MACWRLRLRRNDGEDWTCALCDRNENKCVQQARERRRDVPEEKRGEGGGEEVEDDED